MRPLVVITRTNHVESIHKGYICVTDSHKNITYCIGDPNTKVYLRSSAKPIQAVALASSGAIEKFNISLQELAIICSSHSSEDFHRETVRSILSKIGLSEENLNCGVVNPHKRNTINKFIKKGEQPSQLYNCCSGKHAGMLALCKYNNFPVEGYTEPDHPVQQLILKTTAELLECRTEDITIGIDGCSTPAFMITLHQAAYLYSILAQGSNGTGKYKNALGLIRRAMTNYPQILDGDKEFYTDLITHSEGKVFGKAGVEGIYCGSVPEKQLGICIKISDGNERGIYSVTTHILSELGVLSDQAMQKLRTWEYQPLKNHRARVIGYMIPVFNKHNEKDNIQIGDEFQFKDEE